MAARLARELGFAEATISNVRKGKKDVGEDLAAALAARWGMTYEELEKAAIEESTHEPTDESATQGRLRDRPEWDEALSAARQFYGPVLHEWIDRVGLIYDDVPYPIDARFIGELAESMRSLAERAESAPQTSKRKDIVK